VQSATDSFVKAAGGDFDRAFRAVRAGHDTLQVRSAIRSFYHFVFCSPDHPKNVECAVLRENYSRYMFVI
jgi:hypothetical protein